MSKVYVHKNNAGYLAIINGSAMSVDYVSSNNKYDVLRSVPFLKYLGQSNGMLHPPTGRRYDWCLHCFKIQNTEYTNANDGFEQKETNK